MSTQSLARLAPRTPRGRVLTLGTELRGGVSILVILALVIAVSAQAAAEVVVARALGELDPPDEKPLPPIDGIIPADANDAARLRGIVFTLRDWADSATKTSKSGLEVVGALIPDAAAYRIARRYIEARKAGGGHEAAVDEVAKNAREDKELHGRALVRIELSNPGFELPRERRRLFTVEKSLDRESIIVLTPKDRRIPVKLAEYPKGMRVTELRIQKFWTTSDGSTRRPPKRGDPDAKDPRALGRESLRSKPFKAGLIEDKPAAIELLVAPKPIVDLDSLSIVLEKWKRYEGPFKDDVLDLNDNRPWDEIPDFRFELHWPVGHIEVRPQLRVLVEEVAKKAAEQGGGEKAK
jgi:hypothetical protein